MKLSDIDTARLSSLLVSGAILLGVAYIAVRYLLPVLLPFLLAWGLALLLRPLNAQVTKKSGLPYRLVAMLTLLLTLFAVFFLLFLIGSRLGAELRAAIGALSEGDTPFLERLVGLFATDDGKEGGLDSLVGMMVDRAVEALLSALPPLVGGFVLSLPAALLFVLISVVAAFYFSLDLPRVHGAIRRLFPPSAANALSALRADAFRLGLGYARSYLILAGIIFLIMLLGLSLLGVRYALLLSILLAAVDILPVLGIGVILVPWGIVTMAFGDTGLGIGLLVLFGAAEILRQVIEPKLLGAALGVHPLLSLFSLYLGARLFGLFGLILGPVIAVLLRAGFLRLTEPQKTKNPSNDGISVGHARSTLPERRQREQT